MGLVRFRTSEIQQPYVDWLAAHNSIVDALHEAGVNVDPRGAKHPWNDRSEYSIFEVQEGDLPAVEQASQAVDCSYEYPCTPDINAFDSVGTWHERS